jgi:predicted ABC-type ATPase
LFLREIDRLAAARADFAFESTLSGLSYVRRLRRWKHEGCRIEILYLRIPSVQVALRRIAARVRQGGHAVPREDVVRRFARSWKNFDRIYRGIADAWMVYDNAGVAPVLLNEGP